VRWYTAPTPLQKAAPLASVTATDTKSADAGLAVGIGAYLLWGFLPLLFDLLRHVGSATLVADRTLWSLLFVGIILIVAGRTAEVRAALRDRASVARMAIGALFLAANWLVYVYAVDSKQVLEASFGYFINPLVNVAFGVVLLGERLNRVQTIAVGIAVIAIAIQAAGLGTVPIIALTLAVTFAIYGYLRKTARATSLAGLFLETLVLSPLALGYLLFSFISAGNLGPHADPWSLFLLMLTGPATAVPLLLFAFAVQRLRLSTIGMLQYIAPSIQFVLALTLFGEHLNLTRLLSFGLIWLSLIVYTTDSIVRRRRQLVAGEPV
jgi:chloramphenicol-sensitive protein RarD